MSEGKRIRRTPEQMAQAREEKIAQLEASIIEMENKRAAAIAAYDERIAAAHKKIAAIRAPKEVKKPGRKPAKKRRTQAKKVQELVKAARKAGLTSDEIAQRLGIQAE